MGAVGCLLFNVLLSCPSCARYTAPFPAIEVCHLMPARATLQKQLPPCMLQFQRPTHLSFDVVICAVQGVWVFVTMHLGQRRRPGLLCGSQSACCPSLVSSTYCVKCACDAEIIAPTAIQAYSKLRQIS